MIKKRSYSTSCLSGPNAGDCTWNEVQNFFFNTFSTFGWSVGITFVVWAGLFGYGGIVTKILAFDFWCPVSRLVYGAYLVHPILVCRMQFYHYYYHFEKLQVTTSKTGEVTAIIDFVYYF